MRFVERIDLPVPPEHAWRVAVDPQVIARTLPGLERLEMIGDPKLREGARMRCVLRIGAAALGSELVVTEYTPDRDLVASGVTGIDLHIGLRIRPHGEGARVQVRMGYNPPGGVAGAAAGAFARPVLRARIRRMLRGMERIALNETARRRPPGPRRATATVVRAGDVLVRSGVVRPMRPDKVVAIARQLARWGATPAGAYSAAAVRYPGRLAIVDGDRSLTYGELDRRSTALAVALRDRGVTEGHRVAIAARNHRGFVETLVAVSKAGADALLLNVGFAEPQMRAVLDRERPTAIVCDADLLGVLGEGRGGSAVVVPRVVSAWDDEHPPVDGIRTLDELVVEGAGRPLPPPGAPGRVVLLTSGTTGVPKGVRRSRIPLEAPISLLDRIPYRDAGTLLIAPPLFHAWGFVNLLLAMLTGSTVVLRRGFDPEETLATIEACDVDVLVAAPVMLRRILDLPDDRRAAHDASSLRLTVSSGSALPGELATRWMDEFGDHLYSLYGATEVGWAAIASPEDLRSAPSTAGRVPRGVDLRVFDADGVPMATHRKGLIHVSGPTAETRYTDGTGLRERNGLVDTGDVGYVDDLGRLFVLGRVDDMVVSGGENVYPRVVEDLLAEHPAIAEVAVVGVPDDVWGQRLAAHVVLRDGAELDDDALRAYVRRRRPRFDVPRDVHRHASLPRNAAGKTIRRELAAIPAPTAS
ncbi:MAG: AMP-binding protein [Solirubrobacteraceae bacterium]|nr:AMP-binding protein [Solirubrobacteraceae bacterium]